MTVEGRAQFTHNRRTTEVSGSAAVPARDGENHAIRNHTAEGTLMFIFNAAIAGDPSSDPLQDWREWAPPHARAGIDQAGGVDREAPLESADRLPLGRLDRALLKPMRDHQGQGEILHRQVWGLSDFRSPIVCLVHVVLPPGTTVGYHRRARMEMCYVVMAGSGHMLVEGKVLELRPRTAVFVRAGEARGLSNASAVAGGEALEYFSVAVSLNRAEDKAEDELTEFPDVDVAARCSQ